MDVIIYLGVIEMWSIEMRKTLDKWHKWFAIHKYGVKSALNPRLKQNIGIGERAVL